MVQVKGSISRNTIRIYGVCLVMIALPSLVLAAPISHEPFKFRQPDGSLVPVIVSGDEYYQDVETPDGYSLIRDPATGWICYALLPDDGNEWISTGIVYDPEKILTQMPLLKGIGKHLRMNRGAVVKIQEAKYRELHHMTREEARRQFLDRIGTKLGKVAAPGSSSSTPARSTPDTCVGLAILVDFLDKTSDIPRDSIVDFLNMRGYTGYRNKGSIFDYYYDVSDGKMVYTNFVTQFITADNKKTYYDAGTGYAGTYALLDEIGAKMQSMKIDLSPITLSGNYIKATNVYYAGSPQAGWANGLWPNSGYRRVKLATGVTMNNYQLSDIGTSLSIGGSCHENGHMLCGWPDLYAYDDHDNGAGNYCIMSSVNNNNPVQPNGFFRALEEWIQAINITNDGLGHLYSHVANGPSIYLWSGATNGISAKEAYYIEARRKDGWSMTLPDEGLLIWHVDKGGDNTGKGTDYLMPEQADGLFDLEKKRNMGGAGDLFHNGYKTEFNDSTTPSAKWHNGAKSGIQIANISAVGAGMTFSLGKNVGACPHDQKIEKQACALGITGNRITYSIPQLAAAQIKVKIDLYDLNGAHIITLVNGNKTTGQQYAVAVPGERAISAGTYLCTMNAAGVTRSANVFIK